MYTSGARYTLHMGFRLPYMEVYQIWGSLTSPYTKDNNIWGFTLGPLALFMGTPYNYKTDTRTKVPVGRVSDSANTGRNDAGPTCVSFMNFRRLIPQGCFDKSLWPGGFRRS